MSVCVFWRILELSIIQVDRTNKRKTKRLDKLMGEYFSGNIMEAKVLYGIPTLHK